MKTAGQLNLDAASIGSLSVTTSLSSTVNATSALFLNVGVFMTSTMPDNCFVDVFTGRHIVPVTCSP